MLPQFIAHLQESQLIPEGSRVIVGYSGGADSAALIHLLKGAGIDFVAAHLHHGMRPEADDELARCQNLCDSLDIPFVSGRADVPRMTRELRIGIEEAGRMARYNFLYQAAKQFDCNLIATAHTLTDHTETILFNFIRGTGPTGLTGISASRDTIVRPLLPFTREQTRTYCSDNNLWFHDDPGNEDLNFSRARIRHRITPEIEKINSNYQAAIARCAQIIDEEDRFLNGAAAAALERAEIPLNGNLRFLTQDVEMAFDRSTLEGLPSVLFKRAIRLAAQALGASLNFDQTEQVAESFQRQENGSVTAEGGLVVAEWNESIIHFRVIQPTESFRFKITLPGETESEEFGWRISAFEDTTTEIANQRNAFRVELNLKAVKGELYFRSLQPGDTMQPLGFEGTRKLSDLLSESKLTHAGKARLPIICDFLGPIWAPGVCLSHRISKQSESERVLVLTFGPMN